MEREIQGYRLNGVADRLTLDAILRYGMPRWDEEDPDVYFIRGHVGGCLVAKLEQLKVLDLWFEPIYHPVDTWIKERHEEYYKKEGIFKS
jgi:hypothetical protein